MSGFDFGVFSVFSTVIIIYALITVLQKMAIPQKRNLTNGRNSYEIGDINTPFTH